MATCNEYLNFVPTMNPSWRCSIQMKTPNTMPSIGSMLHDIDKYQEIYERHKDSIDQSLRNKTIRKFLIIFMLNVQREEDIGVQDYGKTKEIIGTCESKFSNVFKYEKLVADSDNIAADEVDHMSQSDLDIPNFPSLGETEKELVDKRNLFNSSKHGALKSELETKNLYKAYKHLAELLYNSLQEGTKENDCSGILDVESCIQESHKILMAGVMDNENTRPGIFSKNTRCANFNGQIHVYPEYVSEEVAFTAVQTLVDKHNNMIEEIHLSKLPTDEKLEYSFKCASLFLFGFLSLHPFGDGNGRLGRLLASYSLLTVTPFMTPIYNVFSSSKQTDYVGALVKAREKLQLKKHICTSDEAQSAAIETLKCCPEDLCAMMIESNWTMWRQFLFKLGILELKLFDWEYENSQKWHNNAN